MRTSHARITRYVVAFVAMSCVLVVKIPTTAGQSRQARPMVISEASIKEFNSIVLKCIQDGGASPMEQLVDWSTIENAISNGIQCHAESRTKFLNELRFGFVSDWVSARHKASKRGRFEFRRMVILNGKSNVIYRMVTDDSGGNYYGLEVAAAASGQLRITDFNEFFRAESFVDVNREKLKLVGRMVGAEIKAIPTASQMAGMEQLEKLQQLQQKTHTGQADAAIKIYNSLPEELQAWSEVQYYRMRATGQLQPGSEQHLDAINRLVSLSTSSLNRDFLRLMGATFRKDCRTAVQIGSQLKKVIGPDAWIDTEIATCYLTAGDPVTARKYLANAIRTEPQMWSPWLMEFEVSAHTSNLPQAVAALNHLSGLKRLPDLDRLEARADLQKLTTSEVYRTWKSAWLLKEQQEAQARDRETTSLFDEFEATR